MKDNVKKRILLKRFRIGERFGERPPRVYPIFPSHKM